MTEKQNLLNGSVPKKLAAFAFPLLLANILQSLYNVVDMLVVGQIVGDTGLAAINNASKLCYIINSICIGMTMGGAVLIAQYKGANDKKGQAETFQTLALLSLVSALLVTVIGLAFYQPLFQALNVPSDAYQDACNYMKIICWGTVFVFGYNAVCSVLKGLGDSKSPPLFRRDCHDYQYCFRHFAGRSFGNRNNRSCLCHYHSTGDFFFDFHVLFKKAQSILLC